MNTPIASKCRHHILQLSKELSYLLERLLKAKRLTKGTVCIQKKKCGNPKCKCAHGNFHHAKVLSFSHQGKTRLIPLTKYSIIDIMYIERQARNYQTFRRNRAKLVGVFNELILELNKMEQNLLIEVCPKKRRQHHGKEAGMS